MQQLMVNDLFNDNIVSIFTDASSKRQNNGKYTTASAVMIYIGQQLVQSNVFVFKDSTISIGELFAVYQGIIMGYEISKIHDKEISFLYSDSKYAISGLTEWLSGWVTNSQDNVFINSSFREVANQKFFHAAVSFIFNNNYNIRLVKTRGHVDNEASLKTAIKYINSENYVFNDVSLNDQTVREISDKNNLVDVLARDSISGELNMSFIPSAENIFPIYFMNTTFSVFCNYANNISLYQGVRKENGSINY